MRHAVLEHPAVARAVGDDLVQSRGVYAFAQAQRHRFGGGGDVHTCQQLVDDLDFAACTRAVTQLVYRGGHGVQHRLGQRIGGGFARGHHGHLAAGSLGRATGDGRIHILQT